MANMNRADQDQTALNMQSNSFFCFFVRYTDKNNLGFRLNSSFILKVNVHIICLELYLLNPLPDNKIFYWSKLKQIANDILKSIQNVK